MTETFSPDVLAPYRERLTAHPIYGALSDLSDLRVFMEHHVYSVWDFMSLIKVLQGRIAPADHPWAPGPRADVRRFINELVLEEESDEGLPGPDGETTYCSHFELYTQAMAEIGADPAPALGFVEIARRDGIDAALEAGIAPGPAAAFTRRTFDFIESGKPHVVAAALALGREHIIPFMFREMLAKMGIEAPDAPAFHYYLNRHIHLDEDFHAPMSLKMLNAFCAGDRERLDEAEAAAKAAIDARIAFWDGVLAALPDRAAAE